MGNRATGISPDTSRLASRLRLKDFQLLLALEQCGSLRAAAEVLNVTQPALTKALREVEDAFNATFFTRSQRGVVLTPEGVAANRAARAMMQALETARQDVENVSKRHIHVRLGMPPFIAHGYFPGLMKAFLQTEPSICARVVVGAVNDLLTGVISGNLDALITTYAGVQVPEPACRLVYEPLFECRYVIIASKNHRFAKASTVKLEKLAADPWIMPSGQSLLRKSLDTAFQLVGSAPPTPVVEVDDPISQVHLVAAGVGLGCVPFPTISNAGNQGVRVLQVLPDIKPMPVAFIYRAGDQSDKLELMRDILAVYQRAK